MPRRRKVTTFTEILESCETLAVEHVQEAEEHKEEQVSEEVVDVVEQAEVPQDIPEIVLDIPTPPKKRKAKPAPMKRRNILKFVR